MTHVVDGLVRNIEPAVGGERLGAEDAAQLRYDAPRAGVGERAGWTCHAIGRKAGQASKAGREKRYYY